METLKDTSERIGKNYDFIKDSRDELYKKREPQNREEYFQMMNARILSAKPDKGPNCNGTAVYIVGEQPREEYQDTKSNYIRGFKGIGGMKMSKEPKDGYLLTFNIVEGEKNKQNSHALVIQRVIKDDDGDHIFVTHRPGVRAILRIYDDANRAEESCLRKNPGLKRAFYIPHLLEKIENDEIEKGLVKLTSGGCN